MGQEEGQENHKGKDVKLGSGEPCLPHFRQCSSASIFRSFMKDQPYKNRPKHENI